MIHKDIDYRPDVFVTLGSSAHAREERQPDDFYSTDPSAIDKLLEAYELPNVCWECACGQGHLSKRLEEFGRKVYSTDLIDRGYGEGGIDFLKMDHIPYEGCNCIITNPPYKYATEFVEHSLELLPEGGVCAMFLKTLFLESQKRYDRIYSINPPKYIFQFVKRIGCNKNASTRYESSAVSYAWFVWEKGADIEDTIIRWINH